MAVYSIWESRFPAETAEEGIRVTKAIWGDMICFDGYLSHELIQDSTSRAISSSSAVGQAAKPLMQR